MTRFCLAAGTPRTRPNRSLRSSLNSPQIGAVSVTFDAGYGTAAQVPEGIKSWIKLRVGSLYAHREEVAVVSRGRLETLPFIEGLLDPYKVALI